MYQTELYHHKSLNLKGKSLKREAVRALIIKGSKALIVHSPVLGDYKLTGGGLEKGEDHESGLKWEVMEECGITMAEMGEKLALISEYSVPKENELDFFTMESHYYSCSISSSDQREQNLDDYERELKMIPVWMEPEEALERNRQVLKNSDKQPKWTKREILFLEHILLNT